MSIAYLRNELDDRWQTTISGRSVDVPKPYIVPQKEDSRASVKKGDVIVVKDGGIESVEPGALGYDAENRDAFVQLDIRTADRERPDITNSTYSPGGTRLLGFRSTADNSSDEHGGLVGEAQRVINEIRKGDNEFDVIQIQEVNDVSEQEDTHRYRALITIRFRTIGSKIDTSV